MTEYLLAEKPCVDELVALGWHWLRPKDNELARDGLNQVILRDAFLAAVQRINEVDEDTARAVYSDMLHIRDNEQWTNVLRGDLSRTVSDQRDKKTIHLIDFKNPANNRFTVTNQLYVQAQKSRIPDVVLYVNGIPLVVIEAKSPLAGKDKSGEAFDQIKQYERDVPRLFYSNLLNIVTDGVQLLYGATGAASEYWGVWKDAWPKKDADFANPLAKGLYCLCESSRLLDMLAHFVVFEKDKDTGATIKKICRYQQYRAVNKIYDRAQGNKSRRGLIWHTQGSGKSLTMVYAALKLKAHLTSTSVFNPNILVLTDRVDLDEQISGTFNACGLPNPKQIESLREMQNTLRQQTQGLVLLSTIFKFAGSKEALSNSANWIVLVDECHRTQEKDLGAYLRATLPEACFFGFTGTPVKRNDRDTYTNFSEGSEGYLDKYGIDDAVADGATVPIRYTGRKTEWHVDPEKLDILFDQWFAHEPDAVIERLKQRGVTIAELAKHPKRVDLIAYDIWTHFHEYIQPDGLKAQIVGIDREAVVLYKQALDKVITAHFVAKGLPEDEALQKATDMSACVYSSSQEDDKPSEDAYLTEVREELQKNKADKQAEKDIKARFGKQGAPLSFLIVCNKLLTGFDAPIEAVMYLDNPLKEHNLLQAIARTNRVYGKNKQFGLIVDYIGITKKLDEALASYRSEDVEHALQDIDTLRDELKAAYNGLKPLLRGIKQEERASKLGLKKEYDALVQALGAEDAWYDFRRKAKVFIRAYEALSPDPSVLDYTKNLRWIAGFIQYGTLIFEKKESIELGDYSSKIREMLRTHLDVTGISTICKVRNITDPEFWDDFKTEAKPEEEIKTAAIRKGAELKKVLTEKMVENPLRYGPFSEKVLDVLKRFQQGQLDAANTLKEFENIANELNAEEQSYKSSGLDQRAYGLLKLIEAFVSDGSTADLEKLTQEIDALYLSDQTAPKGWQHREQLRKELRQQVRLIAHSAGVEEFKDMPVPVEDYALKHYSKVD